MISRNIVWANVRIAPRINSAQSHSLYSPAQIRSNMISKTVPTIGEDFYPTGNQVPNAFSFRVFDIKKGGMGIVYLAHNVDNNVLTGDRSALKTFQDWCFSSPESVQRFMREAEVWVKLGFHRNIVKAISVLRIEDKPYIWMPCIDGNDLRALLLKGRVPLNQIVDYALQFCMGMSHAQDQFPNFVHRDIKPENCLVDTAGVLKITDFGLVKTFDNETAFNSSKISRPEGLFFETVSGQQGTGTLPYMAPEQFEDFSRTDVRTDIYSFGIMLFEMVTGERPIQGDNVVEWYFNHKYTHPTDPRKLNPAVPAPLSSLIMKCLEKDPVKRFDSFGTILVFLMTLSGSYSIKASDTTPIASESSASLMGKASSLHQLGKNDEALNYINQAIDIKKGNPLHLDIKGTILAALGRNQEGIDCFDQEIAVCGDSYSPFVQKAKLLGRLNRHVEALNCISDGIERFPNIARLLVQKSFVLSALGRKADARDAINEALNIDANDAFILFQKAVDLQEDGQYDDAFPYVEKSLELDPIADADWSAIADSAWIVKCKCFLSQGRVLEGYKCIENALEINPENSPALYLMGMLHLRSDFEIACDYNKGTDLLRRSADLGNVAAKEALIDVLAD